MSTKSQKSEQLMAAEPSLDDLRQESSHSEPSVLARRKMLLASLGKGTSLAAAVAIPMQSLAAIGTLSVTDSNNRCSISGVGSAVHSMESVKEKCAGWSPTYYGTLANWPGYSTSTTTGKTTNKVTINSVVRVQQEIQGQITSTTIDETFISIFGGGSSNGIFSIVKNSPNSDEAAWIVAMLNSFKAGSKNFPYSSTQVLGYYQSTDAKKKSDALAFFKGYMQTLNS